MLIGAHVSPAGGLHKAIARGRELGCRAIQIFNQSPRMWRPTAYGRGGLRGVSRGAGGERYRRRAHPRRLPAQLRERRPRDRTAHRCLAHPVAARRRRDRRRRGRPAPGLGEGRSRRPGDRARREGDGRGARRIRRLPAAPGEHRRRRRNARAVLRRARAAHRGRRRRRAPRRLPRLLPPARLRIRDPQRRRADADDRRMRRRGGRVADRLAAPQRLPDAARLQP